MEDGKYKYMDQTAPAQPAPGPLGGLSTPLKLAQWEESLKGHPDQEFAQYLVRGIRDGFRIDFNYREHTCSSAHSNLPSVQANPEVVSEKSANVKL